MGSNPADETRRAAWLAMEHRQARAEELWGAFRNTWSVACPEVYAELFWQPMIEGYLMEIQARAHGGDGAVPLEFRGAALTLIETMVEDARIHAREMLVRVAPRVSIDPDPDTGAPMMRIHARGVLVGAAMNAGPARVTQDPDPAGVALGAPRSASMGEDMLAPPRAKPTLH